MPELPEVETIRGQLAPLVEGRRIQRIEILDPRWSRPLAPAEMEHALRGRRVERLGRRGKYLVWSLSDDVHLAQHLRMTGAVLADPDPEPAHTRVRVRLGPLGGGRGKAAGGKGGNGRGAGGNAAGGKGGNGRGAGGNAAGGKGGNGRGAGGNATGKGGGARKLAFVDPRRFGTGELLLGSDALEEFFAARLGLEPFDEGFTTEHLRALAKGRRAPIKALLLDQRRIAGVGNIYADEALFRAGIHPLRAAGTLTRGQYARLRETVIEALSAGIDARGATIDDFRHVDGVRGSFQHQFLVHLREGEPCGTCGATVVKMVAAGRGTYVCESCQKRPRGLRRRNRETLADARVPGSANIPQPTAARPAARSPRRRAPH
jgi:formamidopyrimidine-DNA glycosylase